MGSVYRWEHLPKMADPSGMVINQCLADLKVVSKARIKTCFGTLKKSSLDNFYTWLKAKKNQDASIIATLSEMA